MGARKGFTDKKRGAACGFCLGILMVALAAIFTAPAADAGCAGDCMTCHANLESSPEHKPLQTCVQCHEASSQKPVSPFAAASDGCGTRCFDCHNQWPADTWHKELDTCSRCHNAAKSFLAP